MLGSKRRQEAKGAVEEVSPPQQSRLGYLTDLRGVAILGVFLTHAIGQYSAGLPFVINRLGDMASGGVQLFFVVSAVTLTMSWKQRDDGPWAFYIRRVFRIAPAFWLALAGFLVLGGLGPHGEDGRSLSIADVAITAVFAHGLFPTTINGLVPGSWTIADEMTFYLFFPLLMAFARSRSTALVLLVAITVLSMPARHLPSRLFNTTPFLLDRYTYYWFPNQVPVFLAGIVAYFCIVEFGPIRRVVAVSFVIIGAAFLWPIYFVGIPGPRTFYVGAAFALLTWGMHHLGLPNTPLRLIGKVSYSAYFWHFAVLEIFRRLGSPDWPQQMGYLPAAALLLMVIVAITLPLAALTEFAIERPFIALGSRLAKRVSTGNTLTAAGAPVATD